MNLRLSDGGHSQIRSTDKKTQEKVEDLTCDIVFISGSIAILNLSVSRGKVICREAKVNNASMR